MLSPSCLALQELVKDKPEIAKLSIEQLARRKDFDIKILNNSGQVWCAHVLVRFRLGVDLHSCWCRNHTYFWHSQGPARKGLLSQIAGAVMHGGHTETHEATGKIGGACEIST